jgi:hypothetical protein
MIFSFQGAKAISDMLKKNKTIRTLQLSNNTIEYSGFASIAEALLENNVLRSLFVKLVAHNPVALYVIYDECAYEVVLRYCGSDYIGSSFSGTN